MELNLAIELFCFIVRFQSESVGESVKLSKYRRSYGIPKATFYRHVKNLLDTGLIEKYGRDRYGVNQKFINLIKEFPSNKPLEVSPTKSA